MTDREREREAIFLAMLSFLEPTVAQIWLHLPNQQLGGFTPSEVIRNDRADLVWGVVDSLRSGAYV